MPKPSTCPDLLDEVRQITITDLRKLGYLRNEELYVSSAPIRWTRGGQVVSSVWVMLVSLPNKTFIEISYRTGDKSIKYLVRMESKPSNLGKGQCWYFICPATNKRCRVLYNIGDYFYSRHAFPSAMYSKQTESKRWREMRMVYASLETRDQFNEKHARKHYNGQPTRRYRRHIALAVRCENRVRLGALLERALGR